MRIIVCWCLLSIAVAASAQVYRWVDSEGNTHYSDHVPQSQRNRATSVNVETKPAAIDPEAEQSRQQMRSIEQARQRERADEAQKATQRERQRAQLGQRCRVLQNKIREEQGAAIFFRYDDKGNRVIWTDAERLAYRDNLRKLQLKYCAGLSD